MPSLKARIPCGVGLITTSQFFLSEEGTSGAAIFEQGEGSFTCPSGARTTI